MEDVISPAWGLPGSGEWSRGRGEWSGRAAVGDGGRTKVSDRGKARVSDGWRTGVGGGGRTGLCSREGGADPADSPGTACRVLWPASVFPNCFEMS